MTKVVLAGLTLLAFRQDFAAKVLADNLRRPLSADPPTTLINRAYDIGVLKPILAGHLLRVTA